jgi:hypothetical protein
MTSDGLVLRIVTSDRPEVLAPSVSAIESAVRSLPPDGALVLDDTTREQHYCQIRRSRADARYWQVEIRLGDEESHSVATVPTADLASTIITTWAGARDELPAGARWRRWRSGRSVFADRPYDLVGCLASPSAEPLWFAEQWQILAPLLRPLVTTDRGRTSVQSLQTDLTATSAKDRPIGFRGLQFSENPHRRWTFERGTTDREFHSTEIWAPGWSVCHRQGMPPEAFVRIEADRDQGGGRVMIATAADRPQPDLPAVHQMLLQLLRPTRIATKRRPWGLSLSERAYSQPIDALGLFREDESNRGLRSDPWQDLTPPLEPRPGRSCPGAGPPAARCAR